MYKPFIKVNSIQQINDSLTLAPDSKLIVKRKPSLDNKAISLSPLKGGVLPAS